MPFTEHGGVRLHWEEQGEGSPLLLQMGATYSSEMWWSALPALATKHRVIRFDNRGTGQSQSSKVASIHDMAADAVAVMDAAGVDQAHVWGVSLGGVVVEELALSWPERVTSLIVGCSGVLTADKPRAPKVVSLLAYVPKAVRMKLLGRGGYGPACPPARAAEDRAYVARDKAEPRALVAQQRALREYSVSLDRIRTGLTMPTLVQHGTADTLVPMEWGKELADAVPDARWRTYEGCGHNYILESGDAAVDDVLAFLEEVDRAQAAR